MKQPLDLTKEQLEKAIQDGVNLEGANLSGVQLQGANLSGAQLQGADLSKANLIQVQLQGADLSKANLIQVQLQGADLRGTLLEGANLTGALLEGANLMAAHLERTNLTFAHLEKAILVQTHLEGASLPFAHLEGADFMEAHLEGADLGKAHLEEAYLRGAHLETAHMGGAQLGGADLSDVTLGNEHHLGPSLVDVQWGTSNLAVVDWSQVTKLGDEWEAETTTTPDGKKIEKDIRLYSYKRAVRANRQLAVALQAQGLSEEAAHFVYRAQRLQRIVLRRQKKIGQYLFSGFLDVLAGYGYKPGRSVTAYLVVIFGFMGLYLLNAHLVAPHLRWDEALVLSISSFHGRGFFSQDISLGDTYARLAAAEAVIGLIIEISFIATFTQRFFGK